VFFVSLVSPNATATVCSVSNRAGILWILLLLVLASSYWLEYELVILLLLCIDTTREYMDSTSRSCMRMHTLV
jgi:hypothetical protein